MDGWQQLSDETAVFFSSLAGRGDAAGTIRAAVLGAVLAGVSCSALGCFITLRRMALFGDMLGHAVLPGVAVGFILAARKSTPALLLGALAAGLLAALVTRAVGSQRRIKPDAALGITLSTFYALGVWLLSWITKSAPPALSSQASGLNNYLFGNPAVIQAIDLAFLAAAAVVVLGVITAFYKELLACAFDPAFATTIGIPRRAVDGLLVLLLVVVIVVSIEILGVVLVAALLVVPAATAYLLTDRLRAMIAAAAALGAVSGFAGEYASFLLGVGTGPAIVCVAFAFLLAAFLFSPRHGVLATVLRHRQLALRTVRENLITAAYRVWEREGCRPEEIPLSLVAAERGEDLRTTRALATKLRGSGWATVAGDVIRLCAVGLERGRRIDRGHRLWELFLQQEASLPADHVHSDAEEIEHFLGEEAIAELEALIRPAGGGRPQRTDG